MQCADQAQGDHDEEGHAAILPSASGDWVAPADPETAPTFAR
jgi:hypothetical protein